MKHTIEELQFAATVREIAIELRQVAASKERKASGSTETADAYVKIFSESHPLTEFVEQVLSELGTIADVAKANIN